MAKILSEIVLQTPPRANHFLGEDGEFYAPGGASLGETSTTAYRGDRGKAAYDHSQITNGNPHGTTAAMVGAVGTAELAKIGTEWLNLKSVSSWTGNQDITNALNDAIALVNSRSPSGGQILIPRCLNYLAWLTNGGHFPQENTMIRGAQFSLDAGGSTARGSRINLKPGATYPYIFYLGGNVNNFGLYDLMLDGSANPTGSVGLGIYGSSGNFHLKTELENAFFQGFRIAIENRSASGTNFQNDGFSAVNCVFRHNYTAFFCNSNNGSFYFKKPLITLKKGTIGGSSPTLNPIQSIAFDLQRIATMVVEGHHIVGEPDLYNNIPLDQSTVLVTGEVHQRVEFRDGQDELMRYFHQHPTVYPYPGSSIVLRNNTIQSQCRPYGTTTYTIADNYFVNTEGSPTFIDDICTGYVRVIKCGQNFVETRYSNGAIYGTSEQFYDNTYAVPFYGTSKLTYFTKQKSHVVDIRGHIRGASDGEVFVDPGTPFNQGYRMPSYYSIANGGAFRVNSTTGTVNVPAGVSYFTVYNNTLFKSATTEDCSLVRGWIEDEPGVNVSKCLVGGAYYDPYFIVYLTAATTAARKVNFQILR